MDKQFLQRIRTEQDAYEALSDAVQASVSAAEWHALIQFNTYCAGKLGWTLVFYRTPTGQPAYHFRPRTAEETAEWIDGQIEDQL